MRRLIMNSSLNYILSMMGNCSFLIHPFDFRCGNLSSGISKSKMYITNHDSAPQITISDMVILENI